MSLAERISTLHYATALAAVGLDGGLLAQADKLPSHVWWRLLLGVVGLAAVGAILIALIWISFRRARTTVREARAEHAASVERLISEARAEGKRAAEAKAQAERLDDGDAN